MKIIQIDLVNFYGTEKPSYSQKMKMLFLGSYFKFCPFGKQWALHTPTKGYINNEDNFVPLPFQMFSYKSMHVTESFKRIQKDIKNGIRCKDCYKITNIVEE